MDLRRGKFPADACALCGSPPAGGCPRCGVELCEAHVIQPDQRCLICESEFEASFSVRDGALYVFTMLACPSLVCLAVLAALSLPGVGVALAGTICLATIAGAAWGFPTARRVIADRARRRFMTETSLPRARLLEGPRRR